MFTVLGSKFSKSLISDRIPASEARNFNDRKRSSNQVQTLMLHMYANSKADTPPWKTVGSVW